MRTILIRLIDVYRLLFSPLVGGQCRFLPSCSCYAREAILRHGAFHGTLLALARLGRCQPFCPGGLDPVP